MKSLLWMSLVCALAPVVLPASAQDAGAGGMVVNFSDPSRPGLVKVNLVNGGVTVKTHTGKDVIISTNRNRGRTPRTRNGLRQIDADFQNLAFEEENNVITILSRNLDSAGGLEIQVPLKTNLNLRVVNGGDIVVEGVEGEIEAGNTNGAVILNNVAGSVIAHASNGRIVASLRDITPNKPMSFVSMNANVDVTLPSTAKANLKMHTNNGATYTDFEIQLRAIPSPPADNSRNQRGRSRLQTTRTINGTINGGGTDVDLQTLNGDIYIHKGK